MKSERVMSGVKTRPVWVWIIGAALLWSSLSGAFLLIQELFSDSLFPPLPVMGDGATAVIAHWCVGLMCGAFLIAGIALLLSRRMAVPLFVVGLVFYAGYITSAFLIAFIRECGRARVAANFSYPGSLRARAASLF